ncbi:hypothetical protein Tco_0633803 [Tanacetum coccineum]
MEDPNITMEDYIKIEEEKARRRGKVYNRETTTYGRIWYDDDVCDLRAVETEFPAIIFNDELTTEKALYCGGQDMALPPRDQRHQYLRFEGFEYTDVDVAYFEIRLGKIYNREVHQVLVLDFESLPAEMADGLTVGCSWSIEALRGKLGGAKRRMSWRQFNLALGLHTPEEMQTASFGLYWTESARKISDKGNLSAYWRGISSEGDFLGTPPSYTLIRDPLLRLCHRIIACSIAERSQAPEKDWVAPGPERQPDAAAGAPIDVGRALDIDEGAQAVPAPVQAP